MKLFHIADLHLGKRVYEFSMLEEQRKLLEQVVAKIKEERPNVLLIAGDVYDKPVPPVEAVQLLNDFLTEVSSLGVHTYLIAGNHDSAQRLEFGRELLAQSGVYFCGTISETVACFQETDAYGAVDIYLLPFFKPAHVNGLFDAAVESYAEAAQLLLERIQPDPAARNVILAHQFVTWRGEAQRSDSETMSVGGVEEIDAGLFSAFDYVALGHLHSPQRMGRDTVRYAGSPMPYSFSEIRQKKGITVVELREKGRVLLDFLPLETRRAFRELRGPLQAVLAAAEQEGVSEDYVRCILTDREILFDPLGRLRQFYPNLMTLEFEKQEVQSEEFFFDTEEIAPDAMFAQFFQKQNGKELQEMQREILEEIWRGLGGAE